MESSFFGLINDQAYLLGLKPLFKNVCSKFDDFCQ